MRYMKMTPPEQKTLLAQLESMPEFLEATFAQVSPQDAATPGPDGVPSPVEQCWHLADLEREGYARRILRLTSEEDPVLPDFDGARIARERQYISLELLDGIRVFRQARAANLSTLRAVKEADWLRSGMQEGVGRIALCDIPAMMAQHDESHRLEIQAWALARTRGAM